MYKTKVMNTRGLYTSKETHIYQNRAAKKAYRVSAHEYHLWCMCNVKRQIYTSKDTYMHQTRPIQIKRGLESLNTWISPVVYALCQKRHIYVKWDLYASKDTCIKRHKKTEECSQALTRCWFMWHIYVKWDLYASKDTCIKRHKKTEECSQALTRCWFMWHTHTHLTWHTHTHLVRLLHRGACWKETYTRDPRRKPKKAVFCIRTYHLWSMCYVERHMYTSKQTYMHQKKPVFCIPLRC